MTGTPDAPLQRRHRALAAWCFLLVIAMVGAAYAAVPLYRMFCEATGFDGTPRRAQRAPDQTIDKTVTVRFDGNVSPDLPWQFGPVQTTMTVKLGENVMAYYRATNTSDRPIKATAAYNIYPEIAASYAEEARKQQIAHLSEIRFAILETSGAISFITSSLVCSRVQAAMISSTSAARSLRAFCVS